MNSPKVSETTNPYSHSAGVTDRFLESNDQRTYHAPNSRWFQLSICPNDPENYFTLTWKDIPNLEHNTKVNIHGGICLFRHFVEMEYTNLTPADLNMFLWDIVDDQNKHYKITN